jgi:hypothetical protein
VKTLIRTALAVGVLLLVIGYVVHAQAAAQKVIVEVEISKNGSVVAKPTIRLTDGSTGTVRLNDDTEFKVTAKVVSQ